MKKYRKENKDKISEYNKKYKVQNKEEVAKSWQEYYKNNKNKINEHKRRQYQENKECYSAYKKQQYKNNKERYAEYSKKYYQKNRDKLIEYSKQYCKENKDKVYETQKRRRKNNRKKINEIHREWCRNNPEKIRIRGQRRRARKKELLATLNDKQWEQIKRYFNNRCAYCGKEAPLTQEHFIPLSKGGEYTINNIIPSCTSCNCSKKDRDFFEWYPKYHYYSKKREKFILEYLGYHKESK
ncbi:HNH endonuclease [Clostridium ganghwense]|uniref:HNH endonuclease n=2 Tax=Clostridium ganghwense TaxID=312089 RepID=A0ABT4CTQ2_9CLOT|nr:HNH endonuclease [Clostridium ganghwense]